MDRVPSVNPLADVCRLHAQLDALDRYGCDRSPARCADPVEALATVERMEGELSQIREGIAAPSAALTMGERAALSHHVQVIAGSLRVLYESFRQISGQVTSAAR